MDEADKGQLMTMIGVSGWMFLLVPAHPGCLREISESRKTVVCVCVAEIQTLYGIVFISAPCILDWYVDSEWSDSCQRHCVWKHGVNIIVDTVTVKYEHGNVTVWSTAVQFIVILVASCYYFSCLLWQSTFLMETGGICITE